jgi:hypothetical protein
MHVEQVHWHGQGHGWEPAPFGQLPQAQLVLLFGSPTALRVPPLLHQLQAAYPHAFLLGCSTAGEIMGTSVFDDGLVATAMYFEHTVLQERRLALQEGMSSFAAGEVLARQLDPEGLVHVLVLSEGVAVNGSALVAGLQQHLPAQVGITGGLAGDGDRFQETLLLWNGHAESHSIVVLGFYGTRLSVGSGSFGGWEAFGPYRQVTRASGNRLYELDGRSALSLYQAYLGEQAPDLPAAGLLFPLSVVTTASEKPVVRTLLAIHETDQSITFAGDVPEGSYARVMRTTIPQLVAGAMTAAKTSAEPLGAGSPDLAVLISCVGRKLVLRQRVEEEVLGVRQVLGERTILTGFYSYGEIAPFTPGTLCRLHNQTMTITTFAEQ